MARITNLIMESSSGSLGNVTFRQVRGMTIASKKIITNSSNTEDQANQRTGFGEVGRIGAILSPIIDQTFDKTKRGSERNNFTMCNKALIAYIRSDYDFDPNMSLLKYLCQCLSDPKYSLKVMMAKGGLKPTNSFTWNEDYELEGTIELSREFKAGDQIAIYVPYTYLRGRNWFESIKSFTKTLTETDIASLETPNCFVVNKQTIPRLETLTTLPKGATTAQYLITGVVSDTKKKSTSYLELLPGLPYRLTSVSQTLTNENEMVVIFEEKDLFAIELADKVTGAYGLFRPSNPDLLFKVKSVVRDADNNTIGLTFLPPENQSFNIPLAGENVGPIALVKDGKQIAMMGNLISPGIAL